MYVREEHVLLQKHGDVTLHVASAAPPAHGILLASARSYLIGPKNRCQSSIRHYAFLVCIAPVR